MTERKIPRWDGAPLRDDDLNGELIAEGKAPRGPMPSAEQRAYEAGAEAAIALAVQQLMSRAEFMEADRVGGGWSQDRIDEARGCAETIRGMPRPDSAFFRPRAAAAPQERP